MMASLCGLPVSLSRLSKKATIVSTRASVVLHASMRSASAEPSTPKRSDISTFKFVNTSAGIPNKSVARTDESKRQISPRFG